VKPDSQGPIDVTPQPITLWLAPQHGQAISDAPKIESSIAYTGRENIPWGRQASNEKECIPWFKLHLLDKADLQSHLSNSNHVREAGILIEKTGKDIVSIIADYLAKFWSYALEDITRARGRRFVSTHRFHVVVTVPAIWQDYAVQRMRRALQQA
jgi:hypothetical protein